MKDVHICPNPINWPPRRTNEDVRTLGEMQPGMEMEIWGGILSCAWQAYWGLDFEKVRWGIYASLGMLTVLVHPSSGCPPPVGQTTPMPHAMGSTTTTCARLRGGAHPWRTSVSVWFNVRRIGHPASLSRIMAHTTSCSTWASVGGSVSERPGNYE